MNYSLRDILLYKRLMWVLGKSATAGESDNGKPTPGNVSGGNISGGSVSGEKVSGAVTSGGSVSGENAAGAETSGGSVSGENAAGAETSGGSVSGEKVSGAVTSGGSVSGENAAGAETSGGSVSGEKVSGAVTSGGSVAGIERELVQRLYDVLDKEEPDFGAMFEQVRNRIESQQAVGKENGFAQTGNGFAGTGNGLAGTGNGFAGTGNGFAGTGNGFAEAHRDFSGIGRDFSGMRKGFSGTHMVGEKVGNKRVWFGGKVFMRGAGVAAAVVLLLLTFNFHTEISMWLRGYGKNANPDIVAKLNQVHDRYRAKLIIDNSFEVELYGDTASFMIDGLGERFFASRANERRTEGWRSNNTRTGAINVMEDRSNRAAGGVPRDSGAGAEEPVKIHTLIVPKGGEFFITLSDGTQVFLNSNAKLTFPSRFTGDSREVQLEGEALFTVSKNGTPFNVVSRNSVTTVLGTVFNVKSCDNSDQVTLCSGSVKVSSSLGGEGRVITPSHQATVSTAGIKVVKADIEEIVAWTEGKFYFRNIPLEEIAAKLNDWYEVSFDFDNPALRQVPFTGMINRNSSLATIFELFELSYNVKFRITDTNVVIRSGFAK